MARTVQQCNDYIVTNLVTQFAAIGITINPSTWSQYNLLRAICWTIAIAQSLAEQSQDVNIAKMQAIQDVSAAASPRWLQDAAFKFQYSLINPQYLAIIGGVPQYLVVDTTLRIITACAISTTISNQVNVKVAKGNPFVALTAGEKTALQSYIDQKGAAGITYNVLSTNADKLYIEGKIYYKGIYSAAIQTAVINGLNSFLQNLSANNFGGDILMSDILLTIKSIEGVQDFVPTRISCRYDSQALFTGIDLVIGSEEVNRKYSTGAGYIVQETTALNTFSDKLTFIAE